MSHINLSIKQGETTKPYIIVNAEYLQEAWLAERREDDSTKIIKQFKCKEFKNCFPELTDCIVHMGEIVQLTSSEVDTRSVNRFNNLVTRKKNTPTTKKRHGKGLRQLALQLQNLLAA